MLIEGDDFKKSFDKHEKRFDMIFRFVWIGILISFVLALVMSIGVAIAGGLGLNWLWNNL